ncbi:MAG: hypothetical protein ACSHYF_18570 [Verrucomicrobiaceae bacterium]
MKAQLIVSKRRGFALIATISVLLLLTLIAVAFLSLSAVTVRTSRTEWAEEEARANARLALMIAIGELQRELGPDQRVSATATILDENPEQPTISGVKEPHWVGVWSTNWAESSDGASSGSDRPEDLTPWERNDERGGLKDRRESGSWDRETAVSTYLVSGNEGGRERMQSGGRQFMDAKDDGVSKVELEDQFIIVSDGSVIDKEDMVTVKAVDLQREIRRPNGAIQSTTVGRYAYYVSDEGTKANISVFDRHNDEQPEISSEEGFQRVFHAQDVNAGVIDGFVPIPDEDRERILSVQTARLIKGVDEDAVKNAYHDITTSSRTVLANVRDGGLQKDLSVFITANGDIKDEDQGRLEYLGLSRTDKMVGPPNSRYAALTGAPTSGRYEEISPQFGILQNWLESARSNGFSLNAGSLDLTGGQRSLLPEQVNYGPLHQWDVWDGLIGRSSKEAAKYTELDKVSVAPVVTEAAIYYNLATRRANRDGRSVWEDIICLYPRISLWNPYSVEMKIPPMICQLFVNGNKEVMVTYEGHPQERMYLGFGGGNHGGNGNSFWLLAEKGNNPQGMTIPPGQTLVFTVDINRSKRQGGLRGDYSKTNYTNNLLTPFNPSSPDRYLLTERVYSPGSDSVYGPIDRNWSSMMRQSNFYKMGKDKENITRPLTFREDPQSGTRSGADNYQFMLKDATGQNRANHGWHHGNPGSNDRDGNLHEFPLIAVGSISLQAGGADEYPIRWDSGTSHPVYHMPSRGAPLVKDGTDGFPNRRTRDGFRLRWWEEHPSNLGGSRLGANEMEKIFQTAGIANWNVRASYVTRTPFDNVTEKAPYFWGNYTRDLFDEAISWAALTPRNVGGLETGFPFGPPNSEFNEGPLILFELPSQKLGIPNLAYLRHLKLSELAWHPTYAIGNSIADPRSEPDGTSPDLSDLPSDKFGGWNGDTMGYASDRIGSRGKDYWSTLIRDLLHMKPDNNNVVFDMSYETNYNLWDTYMIASGKPTLSLRRNEMRLFAQDPKKNPLGNGRLGLFSRPDLETSLDDDLNDFFRAASRLSLEGGFNVHSTSKEAWKAMLSSTMGVTINDSKEAIFPRFLNPSGDTSQDDGVTADSLSGNRELTEDEIDILAQRIVVEVKKRAPFFGLADFVNRRLTDDVELARAGAIEVALDTSGVNASFNQSILGITDRSEDIEDLSFDGMSDSTRLDHRLKPPSQAWGIPGYLTQGDVLGVVGSTLTSRSDTFKIRSYGESRDVNGNILARAWCEATVQRTPEPVNPDELKGQTGINPEPVTGDEIDFGRRFRIVGFRWLAPEEV